MAHVVVTIRYGQPPRPGAQRRRWEWRDVLERPPPSEAGAHEATFTLRHGFDEEHEDPQTRVAYATVLRADVEGIRVEDVVVVEPRVLSPVLVVERALSRRVERGGRAGLRLVTKGSSAISTRVGGKGGAALERSTGFTVGAVAWVGRTVRDGIHSFIEAPDRLWQGATASGAHLSAPRERRALLRGLFNPYALSTEGKAAALFTVGAFLALASLAVTLGVFLFRPDYLTEWRAIFLFFMLGIGSTLLFPFFPEFRLADTAAAISPGNVDAGALVAILTIATAMTIGGWLVLFLGDAIHGAIRGGLKPGSWLARGFDKAEAFARRRGFWTAFIILAIPLGPDTPVFYTLALVKTPPGLYLAGAFLGLLVRFSLFYAGASLFA